MAIRYIEVVQVNDGWLFFDWTRELTTDLHHYFDAHLIKFRNEFTAVPGREFTYFIHGFDNPKQAKDFAVWYHTKPQGRVTIRLNE